jgi:tRNA U34 5-methylaminomethyl-2-thiouridine-forming methyltransferase MnmC
MRDRKIEYKKYNDSHKENHKKWKNDNKKHIKEISKIYYQKNKDRIKEVKKKWNKNNKEKLLIYSMKDKQKHKKHYEARRIAKIIEIPNGQMCEFCNNKLAKERHHEDYSKPLEVKFLCSKCNNPWNEGLGVKN